MTYQEYCDKYFLRSRKILEKENLNPWVKMQCFIRKGPGRIKGIDEAIRFMEDNSEIKSRGGKIYALKELSAYQPNEAIMLIEAPLQSIIEFETIYLGIISAETTKLNDKIDINFQSVKQNMKAIVDLTKRSVFYFGARHWKYDNDAKISKATFDGGATGCSTDEGAQTMGQRGIGTIPHVLVIAFAHKYGKENATLEAIRAFDKHMDKNIRRIALVDTFNREITDSLKVAKELGAYLFGIRLDTCGENFGEGSVRKDSTDFKTGKGVTVELARNVRNALDQNGFEDMKIMLSSGFANINKVRAFVEAEREEGIQLFDGLGVGQLFESRAATADIIEIEGKPLSKTGREARSQQRLIRRI